MDTPSAATERALGLLSSLRLEDGTPWGESAAEWQWEDALAILSPDPPHRHLLTRSRGGSKTTDAAAMAIAALVEQLPAHARAYAFAADQQQAALLIDAAAGFAARTSGLASALQVETSRIVARETGASLIVMASDAASAWGLRPHFVVVDEFSRWPETRNPRQLWTAILSSISKVPTCRLVIITSAGDPGHMSYDVLQTAKTDTRWRVHEVPGPTPWVNKDDLAADRSMLPESEYARLHLNVWTESEDKLTRSEDVEACAVLDGPLAPRRGISYCIAVDLGIVNDRTALVVSHTEDVVGADEIEETFEYRVPPGFVGDGSDLARIRRQQLHNRAMRSARRPKRVVIDQIEAWQGSRADPVQIAAVEEWVIRMARRYNYASIYLDPYQMRGSAQRLQARGFHVVDATFAVGANNKRAMMLYNLVRNRHLAIPKDPALIDELLNIRLREVQPGVFRIDHDPDAHDDRAIAIALGAEYLLDLAAEYQRRSGWSMG